MNQETTTQNVDIPLLLKARYLGTGFAMGVIAGPAVRSIVARFVPAFSEVLDKLTGQAEALVETGSDFVAQAKSAVKKGAHGHDHDHDHDHGHDHHGHGHKH